MNVRKLERLSDRRLSDLMVETLNAHESQSDGVVLAPREAALLIAELAERRMADGMPE